MGYSYPSSYRHDTRVNRLPRELAAGGQLANRPVAQPRQPWAIALERQVRFGCAAAQAGAVAALFMALYTVPALLLLTNRSALAPLYASAAPLLGRRPLEASVANSLHLDLRALLVGMAVTAVVGGLWGVLFGFLIRNVRREAGRLVARGMLFGLAAMACMNLLVLPLTDGPSLVRLEGWTVLTFAHLLFGFLLGCWPLVRPGDFSRRPRLKVVVTRR